MLEIFAFDLDEAFRCPDLKSVKLFFGIVSWISKGITHFIDDIYHTPHICCESALDTWNLLMMTALRV